MAINKATITRILKTANDFDSVGLVIISYYLRLYLVEKILNEVNRPEELTQLASNLLDEIESFKKDLLDREGNDGGSNVALLLNDQDKAKVYFVNFTMNLYNQKLEEMSKISKEQDEDINNSSGSGSNRDIEQDLRRGLWCCIDLFETILHLWSFDNVSEESSNNNNDGDKKEEEQQQRQIIKKRLKYCKLCLSKIAKGKFNNKNKGNIVEDSSETVNSKDKEEYDASNVEEEQEDEGEKASGKETDTLNDDMMDIGSKETDFQLPNVPRGIEDKEPKFIDSDVDNKVDIESNTLKTEEEGKMSNESTTIDEAQSNHHQYSRDELVEMMDHASKIEKIQKLAKYAISALNYEDIVTAKDQLTEALDLLNTL